MSVDTGFELCPGLVLKNRIMAASGCTGWGDALQDFTDQALFGAIFTPTVTILPREGNPMPRTGETPAGLLYSTGLPNPGLDMFLSENLPHIAHIQSPVIVSIIAETPDDWMKLASDIGSAPGVDGIEMNLTPIQLQICSEEIRRLPSEAEWCTTMHESIVAVRGVYAGPLLAKIPSVTVEPGLAASVVVEAGADVVSVGQALPATAVRANGTRRFSGVAGLSGPAIKPYTLYCTWRARMHVQEPIVASGGILTSQDAEEYFGAGATAIAVGVANLVHPDILPSLLSVSQKSI